MIPPLGGILGISLGAHNLQSHQCPGEVQVDPTFFLKRVLSLPIWLVNLLWMHLIPTIFSNKFHFCWTSFENVEL